ncbi:MAG TPA: ATP-binding protein [Symbiobacteriaceae bacterium]|nr:ATP-binding protein [Symbiobacteriaceae bacterium]
MKTRRYRWDQGWRVRMLGLIMFLLSLMCVLGIALALTFSNLNAVQHRADRTRADVVNMEKVTGTFAEMTSALRGYLLSGQESFLQPYYSSMSRMEALLSELSTSSLGDAQQLARVRQVSSLVATWRKDVADVEIAAKRAGRPEAGRLVINGTGLNFIEEIRTTAEDYISREGAKLQAEIDNVSRAAVNFQRLTWFSVSGAAILALAGFLVFARSITRATGALALAAERIAGGERGVVVDAPLEGELQEVAEAFSAMSMTLAAQEEELQAQQEELIAQNEELLAQQDELQARTEQLEKQDLRVSRLNRIGDALIGTLETDQVCSLILDEYLDLYKGTGGLMLIAEQHSERLVVQTERWLSPQWPGTKIKPAGALARCVERQETVVARYPDAAYRIEGWQGSTPVMQEIYIPLVHAGRVIGVALVAYAEATQIPEEAEALRGSVARQAAVALVAALNHGEVRRGLHALQEQAAQVEELNAQLEEERDRASAQLDIYLSIVSTMRPGAWLTDTAGNLLVVNATFQEFFGDVPEGANFEAVLTQMAKQLPYGDPFLGGIRSLVQSVDRTGGGTIQLTNGYVLQWSSAPVGRGNVLVGRLFTFQDVTELAKLDRLKSEFVNTVSHELRTPLTSIMGYLSLVMNEQVGKLEPQQKEFLTVVKRNTDRLSNLINDLLDVQRIEAGRMPLQCRPVQLADVVTHVAETFRVQAEAKGLTFKVEVDPNGIPLISADPDRLTQIASNLVSNAVKYTKEGQVRVVVDQDHLAVRLLVEDSGVGISPADQKRIFEKFFRADNKYAREAGGTGLGLSIVKMLVEEHGGHIKVESEAGKGSRFTVSFPLVLDSPGAD